MKKLYIVMPVINCLELTKAAYNSIKSQNVFILIDNGSDDGTREWGEEMERTIKDFIYRRNDEKKSVAASWNQGIKIALEDKDCKYIAVLNNDILLHPKTLPHLMKFMDKTQYVMVTGDNIKDRMSPEVLMQMELPEDYTDFDLNPISDWRAEGPDFSCFMISPKTIELIGWFDENFHGAYCEDQDYHARINRALRWGMQYGEPDPKIIHAKRLSTAPYYHYASQTLARNHIIRHDVSIQHGKNQSYYVQKWGGNHELVMDGGGNVTPFGDATKNWKD